MGTRVLLVEDVRELRRVIRTSLAIHGGFEVIAEADDGASALRAAREHQPDLVVLDLGLPDLTGRQVLTGLREAAPSAKVVVYSGAQTLNRDQVVPRVEDFVPKEQQIDQLIERLVAASEQEYHCAGVALGPEYSDVAVAREFVAEHYAQWGQGPLLDDARLVVSELVTNALIHSGPDCHLRVSVASGALRLEITDRGVGMPEVQDPGLQMDHGRGLRLVSMLSETWGVDPALDGRKVVWAVLPVPVPAAHRDADSLTAV